MPIESKRHPTSLFGISFSKRRHPQLIATWIAACLMLLAISGNVSGDIVVLYDDTQGNLPAAQPWLFYADDSILSGGTATQNATANGVNLVTDNNVSAGYSNYIPIVNNLKNAAFPTLDRNNGFQLNFELEVVSETHSSNDRAGFSVILLADDSHGIELGFWGDEIWAQNDTPLFTHGEGVAFDTTQGEVNYELLIFGDQYFLSANGNLLLNDSLRDYSAFGVPYSLGSYLFLGDDTGSAGANINLGLVTINSIPEPAGICLVICFAIYGVLSARRLRTHVVNC